MNILEEWNRVKTIYPTKEKAQKAAGIISITEGRLASSPRGPQYTIETRIEEGPDGWQVLWRKEFAGIASGCGGGCSTCSSDHAREHGNGKVIPFKKNTKKNLN